MGRGRTRPPSRICPLPTQRSPFVLFSDIHFWLTDLKIFLKAPLAPIYTNYEGERAPKKRALVNFFPKSDSNTFLVCISKFYLRRKIFGQIGISIMIWESSENQFGRPKKNTTNFLKIFENLPPVEKILDPPLYTFTDS